MKLGRWTFSCKHYWYDLFLFQGSSARGVSTVFRFAAPQRAVIPIPTCRSGTTLPIKEDWWTWFWRGRGTKPSPSHFITSHTKNRGRLSDQRNTFFIISETWKKWVDPCEWKLLWTGEKSMLYIKVNELIMLEPSEKLWIWLKPLIGFLYEDHSTCDTHALKSEMGSQIYPAFWKQEMSPYHVWHQRKIINNI